jgi:hypothetical protein
VPDVPRRSWRNNSRPPVILCALSLTHRRVTSLGRPYGFSNSTARGRSTAGKERAKDLALNPPHRGGIVSEGSPNHTPSRGDVGRAYRSFAAIAGPVRRTTRGGRRATRRTYVTVEHTAKLVAVVSRRFDSGDRWATLGLFGPLPMLRYPEPCTWLSFRSLLSRVLSTTASPGTRGKGP